MKLKPELITNRMDDGVNYSPEDITKSPNNLFGLDDFCKENIKPEFKILELGTNKGVSTSLFAYYASEVVTVDLSRNEKLEKVLQTYDNIKFIQGNIYDVVPKLPNNYFDVVYIDADHHVTSVLSDIQITFPKLKPHGIMSGHDYHENEAYHGVAFDAVNIAFRGMKIIRYKDSTWKVQL